MCSSGTFKYTTCTLHQITVGPPLQDGVLPQQTHTHIQSSTLFSLYSMTHESEWAIGGGREGWTCFNLSTSSALSDLDHVTVWHLWETTCTWRRVKRQALCPPHARTCQSNSHTHTCTHTHTRTHPLSLKAFPAASKFERCSIGWMRLGEIWHLQRGGISPVISQSQCSQFKVLKQVPSI